MVLWRNHFLAGVAAGLVVAGTFPGRPEYWAAGAVSGLAALVPDLDSPRSRLGRDIGPVSWTAGKILGHRGVTHSLVGAVAAALLFRTLLRVPGPGWLVRLPWGGRASFDLTALFAAGYLSHLAMDGLTKGGCPLFWPRKTRYRIPLMTTGSLFGEGIVTLVAVAALAFLLSR